MADLRRRGHSADPTTKRCAIYTRKSSEEGLEQGFNSLHAQREACEAYVLSQAGEGWNALPAEYDDGGFSGGTMERPALKRLLADVDRGLIDVVVVYKVDRLTRALTDFGKIVDRFDAKDVSFVSVTQAFNTTSSMGRLTLNMLLSFAQFEREVTGERIRDKIAASKAKGMWMGGKPPLGYDAADRTLVINETEAELVREVFRRYLELGSVHQLCRQLAAEGVRAKHRSYRGDGETSGPIGRGALFHLLRNRIYRGQIVHHDKVYPGLHPAIVSVELFDAAQVALDAGLRGQRREPGTSRGDRRLASNWTAPLAGLLRDDRGNAMSPTSAAKDARRYRYYTSSALQLGRGGERGSLPRIAAEPLEEFVLHRASWLLRRCSHIRFLVEPSEASHRDRWDQIRSVIHGIELGAQKLVLHFDREKIEDVGNAMDDEEWTAIMGALPAGQKLVFEGAAAKLTITACFKTRGGDTVIVSPDGGSAIDIPRVDSALLRALGRAEIWREKLTSGAAPSFQAISETESLKESYVRRLSRLAFLAPDLKRSVLEGRHPPGLTLQKFMETDLPTDWQEQRQFFRSERI